MLKLLRFKVPNLNTNQQKLLTLHQQPIRVTLVHLKKLTSGSNINMKKRHLPQPFKTKNLEYSIPQILNPLDEPFYLQQQRFHQSNASCDDWYLHPTQSNGKTLAIRERHVPGQCLLGEGMWGPIRCFFLGHQGKDLSCCMVVHSSQADLVVYDLHSLEYPKNEREAHHPNNIIFCCRHFGNSLV